MNEGAPSEELPIARPFLSGKLTVWDIAATVDKPITEVTHLLLPWVEKGIIKLETIKDLRSKVAQEAAEVHVTPKQPKKTVSSSSGGKKKGLIACIDDSAVVIHNLKKILEPAGYKTLSIQEPMAGFAELIKHQPSLILLDLNMPNANGYSVCKFL